MMTDEEMIRQYKDFFALHTKLIDLLLERSRQDTRIIDGFSRLCTLYKDAHNGVCSDWDEQNREYEATLNLYRDITARYEALLREHGIDFDPIPPELLDEPDGLDDDDGWDYLDEDEIVEDIPPEAEAPAAEVGEPAEQVSDRLGQFLLD